MKKGAGDKKKIMFQGAPVKIDGESDFKRHGDQKTKAVKE